MTEMAERDRSTCLPIYRGSGVGKDPRCSARTVSQNKTAQSGLQHPAGRSLTRHVRGESGKDSFGEGPFSHALEQSTECEFLA